MEITLNIEGEVVGINAYKETVLILRNHKTYLYPIKSLTFELEDSPREI